MLRQINLWLSGTDDSYIIEVWFFISATIWILTNIFSSDKNQDAGDKARSTEIVVNSKIERASQTELIAVAPSVRCLPISLDLSNGGLRSLKIKLCEYAKNSYRHPEHVNVLIEFIKKYNIDVNEPILNNGMTLFHCCCISGRYALVKEIVKRADITILTTNRASPLYLATYKECSLISQTGKIPDLRILKVLLEAGDDLNHKNLAGFTALHQAAKMGCDSVVAFLLALGAEPDKKTNDGISPADLSFAFGHSRLTNLLDESCVNNTFNI